MREFKTIFLKKTRMTTFIKAKLKYRVSANITKYHIVSKLIILRIISDHKAFILCKICI